MNYKNLAKSVLTLQIFKQLYYTRKISKRLISTNTAISETKMRLERAAEVNNFRSKASLALRLGRLVTERDELTKTELNLKSFKVLA
jgi:hypothetical protein